MYSNTTNCYLCDKPMPVDEMIFVLLTDIEAEAPDDEAEVTVCEACYFRLEEEDDNDDPFNLSEEEED